MFGFLFEILLDVVAAVGVAMFPKGADKLQESRRSDSPTRELLSWLLIIVLFLFFIFLAVWIFFLW